MGCGGSKVEKGVVNSQLPPADFIPKDIKDIRPEKLRKDITELFSEYAAVREHIRPLLLEKRGLNATLDEERDKLEVLLTKKTALDSQRKPLMTEMWKRDAYDLYQAFNAYSVDKATLVRILATRPKWQISLIEETFFKKYGVQLLERLVNELTTMVGSLLTGGGTGLSRLLIYRVMNQPERDAALLRDCTDGLSLQDEMLLEIICTRSNKELRMAINHYFTEYKKSLLDIVRSKASYKNYRDFVLKILDCQHDEDNLPFDELMAKQCAVELHTGAANVYIDILANVNHTQFESISTIYSKLYPGKELKKDITGRIGGDFQQAVLIRCTDKFEYLARRVDSALTGWSLDNESLCRILGCLSRRDCVKVKEAYNRIFLGNPQLYPTKKPLEETIQTALKGQNNYMNALLLLMSEDAALTPLGSDKEEAEEEREVSREGDRVKQAYQAAYSVADMRRKGEEVLRLREAERKEKKKQKQATKKQEQQDKVDKNGHPHPHPPHIDETPDMEDDNDGEEFSEEDRVLRFEWDGKGKSMDATKLTATFRELEFVHNQALLMRERLSDEIAAIQDILLAIVKTKVETEAWNRIYGRQVKSLTEHIDTHNKSKPATILQSNSQTNLRNPSPTPSTRK